MQVTTNQIDPCTVELEVTIDEANVSRTFESVFREFSRYANVPGFRPGKAPRAVVMRYLDTARMRQHALEKIIQDSAEEAIKSEQISAYRHPEIQPGDLEDKKPFQYKLIVPLAPQVTLGEYTGLTVEKPVFPVKEEIVERRIIALREENTKLDRVTDRPIEAGDVLIVEHLITVEGEEPPTEPRRQLVQLGNNVPGYDEAVLGMNIGEERTFDITYPDDYDEESKQGKKAVYTVSLNSISARRMPDLDDDFAKLVNKGETVEEMREMLQTEFQNHAQQYGNQIAEQSLLQTIVASSIIHFPIALIREEVEAALNQLGEKLKQHNVTYASYLTNIKKTKEEHQTELANEAAEKIRLILTLRDIAEEQNLVPDQDDIDLAFDHMIDNNEITEDQADQYRGDEHYRSQLANSLLQQSIHDFLFDKNNIIEVEAKDDQIEEVTEEVAVLAEDETD